jgi:hypothetical protein
MSATSDWPGESQSDIAFATRVALLSEASKTCFLGSDSRKQRDLLDLIRMASEHENAQGLTFREFLAQAKRDVAAGARRYKLADELTAELRNIRNAQPVDLIGGLFDRLVQLASRVYERPLNPKLTREVIATGEFRRKKLIEGKVLRDSNEVNLLIYSSGFDLDALALVPRVLAHELVCHVGADYTGVWGKRPKPDVREYFSDGFMDRATWELFCGWSRVGWLPKVSAAGQLTVKEWRYSAERPKAFNAGATAFDNCVTKTSEHLPQPDPDEIGAFAVHAHADALEASLRTALRMNACPSHIKGKDWFVHYARGEERNLAKTFAVVASAGSEPSTLFEQLGDA